MSDHEHDDYGERLRRARECLGLAKALAAHTAGITIAELEALERGEAIDGTRHYSQWPFNALHNYTNGMFAIAGIIAKE